MRGRLALVVIRLATPRAAREWVVGDTVEEFQRIREALGDRAARAWLRRETWRVLAGAPRHRLAVFRAARPLRPARNRGDGPVRDFIQDVRYTLRLFGRAPAFTTIAAATLALGIGANTAIFAAVNAVLFRSLPFADAHRLMLVHMTVPDRDQPGTFREGVWSYPKYRTFETTQHVFEEIAFFAGRDLDLSGSGEPQRVRGEVVTERYPAVLGITPVSGRAFSHDEVHEAGTPAAAMISHGLWIRRFGGDPGVVGRQIQVNATPYTVVGVLPPGFRGLIGNADVWVPLAAFEPSQLDEAQSHSYTIVARRRPEVSEQAAMAAVEVLGRQVDAAHARRDVGMPGWAARANSMYASRIDADIRRAALVLLGAVGFVLLIACVNLTNLLAARAMARRREVAVRVAIGAGRGRIVRQFFVEGLLLAALGAIGGLLVAAVLLGGAAMLLPDSDVFFRSAVAPGRPRIAGAAGLTRIGASMIGFDRVTVLFTAAVALLTAMLVSLLPAAQASMLRPVDVLKSGGKAVAAGGRWIDTRGVLVTVQIALALVLLTGAGLMIRSTSRLLDTGIGVDPSGLLTVRVDLPRAAYDSARGQAFHAQLLERIRALPGVEAAALGLCPPVSGGCNDTLMWFPPQAGPRHDGSDPVVGIHWITPDYLRTLGVRVLRGRNFTEHDRAEQPRVLLVNETAARRIWPGEDPVGKRVSVGQGGFHVGAEIIGVVSDVRYRAIETAPIPDVYVPLAQSYQSRMRLFVRTRLDPASLAPAVAREVRGLDPALPLSEVKTMDERVADAMWRTRVGAWMLGGFAGLALLLTAIGVFGVMAQAVTQRTAEIGIRIALGAGSRDVLALVLVRVAALTAAGIGSGTAAALGLTRFMRTLLYGVEPGDPMTFVSVAALLGLIALAAGYFPARRATRVDAMEALRAE
ncbi:MAG TPA: ABC transporter permease [Vicinamibacterales bacterium]|nr:ABC transporter permease [Vicinamibacterales bacterium]